MSRKIQSRRANAAVFFAFRRPVSSTALASTSSSSYTAYSSVTPTSFHKRELPSSLISFSSPQGKALFRESMLAGTMESFFPLSEQFVTQSGRTATITTNSAVFYIKCLKTRFLLVLLLPRAIFLCTKQPSHGFECTELRP